MIPRTIATWQEKSWQEELSAMITRPGELLQRLKLPMTLLAEAERAAALFPLKVTHAYADRMAIGSLNDPLLKQVLPLGEELQSHPGFNSDPLDESRFNPVPGLIHKYKNRVLLIAAPQCAIHCRYCFRREFDYSANQPSRQDWQHALTYIRENSSITEVILSGGDPLALPDRQLSWLIHQLDKIEHLTTLRIHSRLPIVLPSRVTAELLALLSATPLRVVLVVHANHAQEIDEAVGSALLACSHADITVLNQTVLLRGVNNCASTLAGLSHTLFQYKVLPYYLHLLDRVSGTAHFDVSENEGKAIHTELRYSLPGYLVPRLVRESPGERAKSLVL